jgi:hypothetical protein
MKYYIWGLQRSGTNYLNTLVKQNFSIKGFEQRDHCWKHSINIPEGFDPKNISLVIHKNPYTWVESLLYRRLVDFPRSQRTYPIYNGPGLRIEGYNITNMAKTYLHFYNTWAFNPIQNKYVVRYEDLLEQEKREQILEDIGNRFNLKRSRSEWFNPAPGRVILSSDYTSDRNKYYVSGQPEKLSNRAISEINHVLGEDIFKKFRYDQINNFTQTHNTGDSNV